ncbi:hypothetical protein ACWDNT_15385, partial [Streptomyces sp. NPDC000963]
MPLLEPDPQALRPGRERTPAPDRVPDLHATAPTTTGTPPRRSACSPTPSPATAGRSPGSSAT